MSPADGDAAEQCPVDHTARQKWLDAAKDKQRTSNPTPPIPNPSTSPPTNPLKLLHQHGLTKYSLDTGRWEPDFSHLVLRRPPPRPPHPSPLSSALPTDRQISSIPRAQPTNHDRQQSLNSAERAALPPSPLAAANNERDTGHDGNPGNWIYPSQEMFFAAMKRKGHDPQAADMATIVPIHNAVNERAWAEIKTWEAGRGSEACGGPKLVSFSGDSSKLTPRARWKSFVGYQKPFDRHDWVVERCGGERVEYVIDFYSGRDEGVPGKSLNFHLDVRPKLNSWEGWKMRGLRAVGW